MATITSRYPVAQSGGELARRTALGVLVAVVAALLVNGLVGALGLSLGVTGPASPFTAGPILGNVVVAGVGAAVAYAALVRLTERPVRNFAALAAAVFALMLVPVFAVAPAMGVSGVGQAVLVALHVVVAVPLVAFIVGAVRL
ncbi:DUF6069 family protein [Haloarcula nitratireducens]|uniref:Uncharacterized protein n=1 Tax=Haloarcula nitratireducens TaxID=2487749 RepID=A0AAW4P9L1_9EURY|nr:DUF6069 family protein [Halomicroarcula nitratireducens]MBX0294442.1 hypothetical protein [Halomicroarcula nitratireducens]